MSTEPPLQGLRDGIPKIINCHPLFIENAMCLSNKTGWKIETDFQPQCGDLYIVFGSHEIAPTLLQARDPSGERVRFVIMQSEQENSQFLKNKYYLELMKRNVVVSFTSVDYLAKFDIKILSYFDFEFIRFDLEMERIYDITFIGSYSKPREEYVEKLKKAYPDKKFYIDFEWMNTSVKDITEVLSQSKYVLNLPYYENSALESHRINKAVACGCEVVSMVGSGEKGDTQSIYEKYIHFTDDLVQFFETDKLPRADYANLMKELHTLHLSDLMWVVRQVHKGRPPLEA